MGRGESGCARGAKTYCIVTSGRALGQREMDTIRRVVPEIKRHYALAICMSPGLLNVEIRPATESLRS